MTLMHLSRRGYGSILELSSLDTPAVLDLIEFENMTADIEDYIAWEARNG